MKAGAAELEAITKVLAVMKVPLKRVNSPQPLEEAQPMMIPLLDAQQIPFVDARPSAATIAGIDDTVGDLEDKFRSLRNLQTEFEAHDSKNIR